MTEYYFNAELAQRHGVNGAIFLHSMAFWVAKNRANGRHFHQGRTWTYNTLEALSRLFPFWTRRQLERIIARLREEGVLLTGNFSEDKTDRTIWYALADSVLEVYGLLPAPISPNGEMHFTKQGDGCHQTVKCNKESVTDQIKITPPIVPQGDGGGEERQNPSPDSARQEELFERFWTAYPPRMGKRAGKKAARKAWDKLKPDLALCRRMGAALARDIASAQWREANGRYIPLAATWLNGRSWEDEYLEQSSAPPTLTAREEVPTW